MRVIRHGQPLPHRHKTLRLATTLTLGSLALMLVGGVFCLFIFLSVLDDTLRWTAPERIWLYTQKRIQANWPRVVGKLSEQLTSFAEWEKQQRATWAPPTPASAHHHHRYQSYSQDTFYDIITSITRHLDQYAHIHTPNRPS
ncbi:hypothetical protein DM01DRAFT_1336143 [Hesseltinella vesiculosa]|uniref:Uncharacterized protein n=1 Tax=Hesseltinella vesiculosa TaxID=101127 RepID=A0A1X2GIA2_9FUNG|nr:hypothetical protein DM01DRAFT_1336143 [Hesseltinella vesiculosa]